jgi:hypothetical protein
VTRHEWAVGVLGEHGFEVVEVEVGPLDPPAVCVAGR